MTSTRIGSVWNNFSLVIHRKAKLCEKNQGHLTFASINTPEISISPNPAASNGTLNISTNLAGKVKLKLYDAKGRAVRVAVFEQNGQLVLNGLPAGIYTCAVESELAMWFGKVVVE
jgi:hypothetical protein